MSIPRPRLSLFALLIAASFLLSLLVSGGCEGMKNPFESMNPTPASTAKIIRVDMFCPPMASDFNGDGKSDGVPARVMFYAVVDGGYRAVRPKGEIEFRLYEGRLSGRIPASVKPLEAWTVTSAELANYEGTQFKMVCYQMPLRWKTAPPAGRITFTATFTPLVGAYPTITSEPVVLPFNK
jgi:hypothetical protein